MSKQDQRVAAVSMAVVRAVTSMGLTTLKTCEFFGMKQKTGQAYQKEAA